MYQITILGLCVLFSASHGYFIRCNPNDRSCFKILSVNQQAQPEKRCANLLDESCINGGLPGAGSDGDWLTDNSPGKRSLDFVRPPNRNTYLRVIKSLSDFFKELHLGKAKNCDINLMDESCINGGLPDAGADDDWLNNGSSPGRR